MLDREASGHLAVKILYVELLVQTYHRKDIQPADVVYIIKDHMPSSFYVGCGEGIETVGLLKVLDVEDFEALDWKRRDFRGLRPGCAGALISDRLVLTAAICQGGDSIEQILA